MSIEEISESLYKVEVPLPNNPLKTVNSYFIKSRRRNLIIDTGMNRQECKEALLSAVDKLKIDLHKTDFFITHFHADHLDLVPYIATNTSRIYLNGKESDILHNHVDLNDFLLCYSKHGFPIDKVHEILHDPVIQGYNSSKLRRDYVEVFENDVLEVGEYSFNIIETPGHTPGHSCLYEPEKKILISGDHILFDITPNITFWPFMENSLSEYLINLKKIYPLEVNLVLPGHRNIQNNHQKRIDQLIIHHKLRSEEILAVLDKGGSTAYQIAPLVKWNVNLDSWQEFPAAQQFFALGEVIAHLKYLEEKDYVCGRLVNDEFVFAKK